MSSIGAGAGGAVVGAAVAAVAVGGGAPPHVLAVDDSSVDRAVIAGILRSSRFRGTCVVDAYQFCFLFCLWLLLLKMLLFWTFFWCSDGCG
jgi:hypothetical protein